MINPYFLTHQSANLIEDFVREIARDSSLFLLYGESGVGKSSLLRQIREKRFAEVNTHWIDFNETLVRGGDTTTSRSIDLAKSLKALAEKARRGDVIFIDHFEAASNKEQRQLFESWSVEGRDKHLNFIVASASTSFTVFQQLAQQMQIDARCFQLMPCNPAEAETYVQSVLFPDDPFARMLLSKAQKQQLRACKGVFASLDEFVGREGGQIAIDKQIDEKSNVKASAIIGVLLLVLIAAGYLIYLTQFAGEPESEESELEVPASVQKTEAAPNEPPIRRPETAEIEIITPEKSESNYVESERVSKKIIVEEKTEPDSFQAMLSSTKHWIENGKSEGGTIQIMSIGLDRFGADEFEKYLQNLQANNVDVSRLRFFQTKLNHQDVYTIIYGEYANRREAGLQVKTLPKVLVAAKPFPRTIGGILNEIEKVEE